MSTEPTPAGLGPSARRAPRSTVAQVRVTPTDLAEIDAFVARCTQEGMPTNRSAVARRFLLDGLRAYGFGPGADREPSGGTP